jgi:deoxyribonuclease V
MNCVALYVYLTKMPIRYNRPMPHPWNLTPKEAVQLQNNLREQVRIKPLAKKPRLIAGADVSMNLYSNTLFAGFIVLFYPDLTIVDHVVVKATTTFPYIPGLLSFREIPALLKAWEKLEIKPDLVIVDGVGVAHPRRIGIASHLGVLIDKSTIGCAKSVLTGTYEEPAKEAGSLSYLFDPKNKEVIGAALRTKKKVKPVFISPGHNITLDDSLEVIRAVTRSYRIPEPTRLAHNIVNEYRKKNI